MLVLMAISLVLRLPLNALFSTKTKVLIRTEVDELKGMLR